jgi:ribosome biogenesis protein ENP2
MVGSGSEAYRLNLEQGRFLKSWETSISAINSVRINPQHRLFAMGGENGVIEYWDPRYRKCVGSLSIESLPYLPSGTNDVTSLHFLPDGLTMAVGTSSGFVLLYDLRSPIPFSHKDHQYGYPVKKIDYHEDRHHIVSADCKVVKVWNKNDVRCSYYESSVY